jgi:hypothetical protein
LAEFISTLAYRRAVLQGGDANNLPLVMASEAIHPPIPLSAPILEKLRRYAPRHDKDGAGGKASRIFGPD